MLTEDELDMERIRLLRVIHATDSSKGYTSLPVAIGSLLNKYDEANEMLLNMYVTTGVEKALHTSLRDNVEEHLVSLGKIRPGRG